MASLDPSLLKQFSAESLSALLRQLAGDKDLVLEGRIMRCLAKIAGMEVLRGSGVRRVFRLEQMAPGSKKATEATAPTRVFILQASLEQVRSVADLIKASQGGINIVLVFLPKLLQSILTYLEEEGLVDKVLVREYCWQMIPVDTDVFSLELPLFFSQCIIDGYMSQLSAVSKTLLDAQGLYGTVSHRVAFGKKSAAVLSQLALLESKCNISLSSSDTSSSSELSHLLVVDRDADFAPCLLSPVTYEALLDEVFGISLGQVDFRNPVAGKVTAQMESPSRGGVTELTSKDRVFEQVRHRHFGTVGNFLQNQTRQLENVKAKASNMNVNEMKDFVQNSLKDYSSQTTSCAVHIAAGEVVTATKGFIYKDVMNIEEELLRGTGQRQALSHLEQISAQLLPADVVFRLFCLASQSSSAATVASAASQGLSSADYARFKKLLCEAYGYRHAATFLRLERSGALAPPPSAARPLSGGGERPEPRFLRAKLGLVPPKPPNEEKDDRIEERDPSFVFHTYTPAVCKLAKMIIESPEELAELAKSNPSLAITVPLSQQGAVPAAPRRGGGALLIFFVGGFTLGEVSALRTLQATLNVPIIVAGTSVECGRTIMGQFLRK